MIVFLRKCVIKNIQKKGTNAMYISKRLKELRTVSGFSQEKLAELLDVSRQTISSWENERSYPDVHNLIMLCDIYSVSLDDLMKGAIETMKKEVANTTLNKSPPRCNTTDPKRPGYDYRTAYCGNWSYHYAKWWKYPMGIRIDDYWCCPCLLLCLLC